MRLWQSNPACRQPTVHISEAAEGVVNNLIGVVFNDEQYRCVDATHTAIERLETEAVMLRAVQKSPRTTLGARRQVKRQLHKQTDTV